MQQARRYRPKWWIRLFALFFFLFCSAGSGHFLSAIFSGEWPPNWVEIVGPAFLALVGLAMVIYFFTTFVTLFPDAIQLETLFSRKRLQFTEIRGRHEYTTTDSDGVPTHRIELRPHDRQRPTLKFDKIFNFDRAFYEWLSRVPNLER
jgi:hypothetical protein